MEEHTAFIRETETEMADGSTHVHCEAVMHDGQKIAAGYNVPPAVALPGCTALDFVHIGNGSFELREDYRARHRAVADKAIRAKIAELVAPPAPAAVVSFNPRTCDPVGEGEELAKAITDAVADKDTGAIGALLQAAECLGAWILRLDDAPRGEIVDKLYENDAWREHLKIAIAEADAMIAADANPDPGISADITNVLGTPLGDHEHRIASGEIPGVPGSGDDSKPTE